MEITSLKQYKGAVYEVELDDSRKLYLHADIIADFGLRTGTQLERAELRKIVYASNYRRAFQRALYLLDYRDYSYKEMFGKLVQTYKNEELCFAVMKKLTEIGVINDVRYAEKLARKLVEVKRFGLIRAKRELLAKGIDRFTAEDALEEYRHCTAENLAYLLETKYSRLLADETDIKSIEKVKSALVRYGYGFSEVGCAVREYFENAYDSQEDI
ncbi:MAG: regulatory protein RecX [Ruminococcus sp.]|nr:regulatory protein RecX [Ruminococcus sp.]